METRKSCRNCGKAEIDYKFQEIWCEGKEQETEEACDKWKPRESVNGERE